MGRGSRDLYLGKGLTSLTMLILRHLKLNTILNKMALGLNIVDSQWFEA
jgi:hypothetical protein